MEILILLLLFAVNTIINMYGEGDIMEILILLFAPPVLVVLNLIWHFGRKDRLIYEIVCNLIGVSLMLWLTFFYIMDADKTGIFALNYLLPFAVIAYLYMKYSADGDNSIKKAAMAAALLYAVIITIPSAYFVIREVDVLTDYPPEEMGFVLYAGLMLCFYYLLVPLNYFITAVSEALFQLKGRSIYWIYQKKEG